MIKEKNLNSANSGLGEFSPIYFSFVGKKIGSEFYHSYKSKEPWVWHNCGLSFSKISDNKMKFVVRRQKNIQLNYDPKTCGMKKNNLKKDSQPKEKSSPYTLRYFIEFEVSLDELSYDITHDIKKILVDGKLVEKESWLIKLDEHHHIWRRKDANDTNDSVLSKLKEEILKKKNGNPVTDILINHVSKNTQTIPVICHPARDFSPTDLTDYKNYVREIHLYTDKKSKKIHATIVFTGERLRTHWYLHYIYKVFRLLVYGRTFDVESFNIIPGDQEPIKFDFPKIYSKNNNIYNDNIHENRCSVDAIYYLDNFNHPLLFVNTANHAMAESDSNSFKWKVEYLPWEHDSPICLGHEKRCDIEKRLRVFSLNPFLLVKCNNSKYTCCNDE